MTQGHAGTISGHSEMTQGHTGIIQGRFGMAQGHIGIISGQLFCSSLPALRPLLSALRSSTSSTIRQSPFSFLR